MENSTAQAIKLRLPLPHCMKDAMSLKNNKASFQDGKEDMKISSLKIMLFPAKVVNERIDHKLTF